MLGSKIIRYTVGFLHQLKKASLQTENYGNFSLRQQTRANIIDLGICRQPTNKVYRRLKGGKKLFHKITSIINNEHFDRYTLRQEQANLENIREIKLHQLRVMQLVLLSVNARSICNKTNSFQQYITENNIDLCAITETWIKETYDINLTKEIPPMGYNIISHPHKTGKQGGGLALTYRNTIKLQDKTDNTRNYETMEHSNFDILFAGTKIKSSFSI